MNHLEMVGQMIIKLERVINKEKPDFILVYGDTNSTLAGAISASKKNIPLIHIESGLRSNNLSMPEEVNRIITDRMSQLLFCPSNISKKNLLKENFHKNKDKKVLNFGDVMFDIHQKYKSIFQKKLKLDDYYLVTIHREENCKTLKLKNIMNNLIKLSKKRKIIFPVHPRIKEKVKMLHKSKNIILTKPLSYKEFGQHLFNSYAVITDSGGVQKESFYFKKNCFVLRKETEWKELVNKKYNILINVDSNNFYKLILSTKLKKIDLKFKPYGDGKSAVKIVKYIYKNFNKAFN